MSTSKLSPPWPWPSDHVREDKELKAGKLLFWIAQKKIKILIDP
jgi:hypothetical protein